MHAHAAKVNLLLDIAVFPRVRAICYLLMLRLIRQIITTLRQINNGSVTNHFSFFLQVNEAQNLSPTPISIS